MASLVRGRPQAPFLSLSHAFSPAVSRSQTLYATPGSFRAFKVLIAAEYNGIAIDVPEFAAGANQTPEFLAKSPFGRAPCLETPQGCVTESNAIARYVAGLRTDTELLGGSFMEKALVDSWMEFCSHDLEMPATIWFYPVIGLLPYNQEANEKARVDLATGLKVLEKHLADGEKAYLVGDKITLADIAVASALVYPMKLVMNAAYRKDFPNVQRWFTACASQPQFTAVIGKVELCREEMVAPGAPPAERPKK